MEKCGKVGEAVVCVECGRTKKPLGRSAPMEMVNGLCDFECAGYYLAPFPWWPTPAKEGAGE